MRLGSVVIAKLRSRTLRRKQDHTEDGECVVFTERLVDLRFAAGKVLQQARKISFAGIILSLESKSENLQCPAQSSHKLWERQVPSQFQRISILD